MISKPTFPPMALATLITTKTQPSKCTIILQVKNHIIRQTLNVKKRIILMIKLRIRLHLGRLK